MRRISIPRSALALTGVVALAVVCVSCVVFLASRMTTLGEADHLVSTPAMWSPEERRLLPRWALALGPGRITGFAPPPPPLIKAYAVGPEVRYLLQSGDPAEFLQGKMLNFLLEYRFGVGGRPMVVRLLDGEGRFAWAAEYDGAGETWVRARFDLARCGPYLGPVGQLGIAVVHQPRQLADAPCPAEPQPQRGQQSGASILR